MANPYAPSYSRKSEYATQWKTLTAEEIKAIVEELDSQFRKTHERLKGLTACRLEMEITRYHKIMSERNKNLDNAVNYDAGLLNRPLFNWSGY